MAKIINRRARYEYRIFDSFEAGIVLSGSEVKSIKAGRGDLSSSFVRIKDGEAWLVGANIPLYASARDKTYDPLRQRKLLLHKKELVSAETKLKQQRLTLIPLSLYTRGRLVKAQVAFAKGKKQHEKREAKKRKDVQRELSKALRGR